MLNVDEISGNNVESEVLLSFLKKTREGVYAPIRESDLCFVRVKETTEYNEYLDEEFYYNIR